MPDHPFHRTIGDLFRKRQVLKDLGLSPDAIWFDTACSRSLKKEVVTLFYGTRKDKVRFCLVDILMLVQGKLVIIEIEESNVKPLHLFGKFFASAFATHFNDQDISRLPLLFIQVLDTSRINLEEGQKGEQWDRIEAILEEQANDWPDREIEYRLFEGQSADFSAGGKEGEELLQALSAFLKRSVRMDDGSRAPYGLSIHIRSAWGAEQSFQLVGKMDRASGKASHVLKFRSDGPPYETTKGQVDVSQEQVEAIYALLQGVNVGPIPTNPDLGLDGETTTVTIMHGQNRVELEYWDAPKPWKPLEKLVEMARELAQHTEKEDSTR